MERLVKGDIVTLNFPFTDLSGFKKRPALVVSTLRGDDIILCQITTKDSRNDEYAIELTNNDFISGSLPIDECLIRVNRLFTGDKQIILKKSGRIVDEKLFEAKEKLKEIISN
jgi:mRNA interferase MazF